MSVSLKSVVLSLVVVLAAAPARAASSWSPCPGDADEVAVSFEEQLARYQAALSAWKDQRAQAEREERKALAERHPVRTMWPAFDALARGGEGRALLWQLENVRSGPLGLKDRKAFVLEAFGRFLSDHAQAAWLDEALALATKSSQRRILGAARLHEGLRGVVAKSEVPHVRAAAFVLQAELLLAGEEGDAAPEVSARERALELLERAATEDPASEWGERAEQTAYSLRYLSVGSLAQDFEGTTFEGETFRLSDHRGKVVVLDFFGFW